MIKCIGKESNSIENVESGQEHSEKNVYTAYADPKRSEWITKIQPALKQAKLEILVRLCKNELSRREIIERRAGRKKPHRKTLFHRIESGSRKGDSEIVNLHPQPGEPKQF